ncbi:MAG: hypothetical protein EBS06_05340 [Proteobacteria bacterium]|nr:hypothetical protein [Pseudomonadota bacterium]
MKIVILITTFRRNKSLRKLLRQINGFYEFYKGKNNFKVLICNSDAKHALNLPKIDIPFQIITNNKNGFDMNLLNGFAFLKGKCDYVYLMGDDDLFAVNPFFAIDNVFSFFRRKKNCYLFNHLNQSSLKNCYNNKLIFRKNFFLEMPRYCGLMYKMEFINSINFKDFDHTLHLYALPFLYSVINNNFRFVNDPICVFNDSQKKDGAWQDNRKILDGLKKFLKNCSAILEEKDFAELCHKFFNNYFRQDSVVFRNKVTGLPYFQSAEDLIKLKGF